MDNDYNILYFDRSGYKIDLKTMFMEGVLHYKWNYRQEKNIKIA